MTGDLFRLSSPPQQLARALIGEALNREKTCTFPFSFSLNRTINFMAHHLYMSRNGKLVEIEIGWKMFFSTSTYRHLFSERCLPLRLTYLPSVPSVLPFYFWVWLTKSRTQLLLDVKTSVKPVKIERWCQKAQFSFVLIVEVWRLRANRSKRKDHLTIVVTFKWLFLFVLPNFA